MKTKTDASKSVLPDTPDADVENANVISQPSAGGDSPGSPSLLCHNDREALAELIVCYGAKLLERAKRILYDDSHAQDVVVDGLLHAAALIRGGQHVYDYEGFLMAHVAYKALDQNKKTRRQQTHDGISLDQTIRADEEGGSWAGAIADLKSAMPLEGAMHRELLAMLSAFLPRLPIEMREVVHLRFFEDLTFKEIGELQGVPLHTAVSRCRRAVTLLRTWFGNGGLSEELADERED